MPRDFVLMPRHFDTVWLFYPDLFHCISLFSTSHCKVNSFWCLPDFLRLSPFLSLYHTLQTQFSQSFASSAPYSFIFPFTLVLPLWVRSPERGQRAKWLRTQVAFTRFWFSPANPSSNLEFCNGSSFSSSELFERVFWFPNPGLWTD